MNIVKQTICILTGCIILSMALSAPVHAYARFPYEYEYVQGSAIHQRIPAPASYHFTDQQSRARLGSVGSDNFSYHHLNPHRNSSNVAASNRRPIDQAYLFLAEKSKAVSTANAEIAKPSVQYSIQSGDTLFRIANFFETTVDLLMIENGIDDPTKLKIGQKLMIPADIDVEKGLNENSKVVKTFQATLTAYTAGYESTGKTPSHPEYGVTSSGAKVQEDYTIAVDPTVIPIGSLVYIDGLGIRKAQDTGSAIKGNKIDVYIPDLDEALTFGVKKNVKVYVLDSDRKDVQVASSAR